MADAEGEGGAKADDELSDDGSVDLEDESEDDLEEDEGEEGEEGEDHDHDHAMDEDVMEVDGTEKKSNGAKSAEVVMSN